MDDKALLDLLNQDEIPAGMPPLFQAVWHALGGRWDDAHTIAQDDTSDAGAWVHAWLHRIEGDFDNAGYWYRRAGRSVYKGLIKDEGHEIAAFVMSGQNAS